MDEPSRPQVPGPPDAWIGQLVGSYRISHVIGEGGMARVYLAVHQQIGKQVAIKILGPSYAADPEMVTRFLNEARAAGRVQHPGIVNVFDQGTLDGAPYLVMEFIDGISLHDRLERSAPVAEALRIGRDLALALATAHDKGVIHRDLKPSNVMLERSAGPGQESVKLVDFGIAKLQVESLLQAGPGAPLRTRTGAFMGTPAYMARSSGSGRATSPTGPTCTPWGCCSIGCWPVVCPSSRTCFTCTWMSRPPPCPGSVPFWQKTSPRWSTPCSTRGPISARP